MSHNWVQKQRTSTSISLIPFPRAMMSSIEFGNAISPQYPTKDRAHFAEFLNRVYANMTAAKDIKHVSFAPFEHEVGLITSLIERFTWDTTMVPATVKPLYQRELSTAVRKGLKENGFEKCFVYALHRANEVGAHIELEGIPKDHLFLLHTFAISPCKNVRMLTVPSQWYAHTDGAVKEELQECFPQFNVSLRVSNEDGTLVRIGGPENYIIPVQSVQEHFLQRPRCVRCKKTKKWCNRGRPCDRCSNAGLGFNDCIPEDARFSRDGIYGGNGGKGLQAPTVEVDQIGGDVNATGADDHDPTLEQDISPSTETQAHDEGDAATENGTEAHTANKDAAAGETESPGIFFFKEVNEYLGNRDRMHNFLKLYQSFFTAEKRFEDLLKEAATFIDERSELFADLKDHMRTEEDRDMLDAAFTRFLEKWNIGIA